MITQVSLPKLKWKLVKAEGGTQEFTGTLGYALSCLGQCDFAGTSARLYCVSDNKRTLVAQCGVLYPPTTVR